MIGQAMWPDMTCILMLVDYVLLRHDGATANISATNVPGAMMAGGCIGATAVSPGDGNNHYIRILIVLILVTPLLGVVLPRMSSFGAGPRPSGYDGGVFPLQI